MSYENQEKKQQGRNINQENKTSSTPISQRYVDNRPEMQSAAQLYAAIRANTIANRPSYVAHSNLPAQRAGEYRGQLPAHKYTEQVDYGNDDMTDYTYHHIMPETYISETLTQARQYLKDDTKSADENDAIFHDSIKDIQGLKQIITKAENWQKKVMRQIIFKILNRKINTFNQRFNLNLNWDDRFYNEENNTLEAVTNIFKTQLIRYDNTTFYQSMLNNQKIKQNHFDIFTTDIESGNQKRNFFHEEILEDILFDYNEERTSVDSKRSNLFAGIDLTPSDTISEIIHLIEWIPGNIHQGPKSEFRIQGESRYSSDSPKPNKTTGFHPNKDDGGGNFEMSAKKIVDKIQFTKLLNFKDAIETIRSLISDYPDRKPIEKIKVVNQLSKTFNIVSQLYDFEPKFFHETEGKWELDTSKNMMRLK